MDKVRKRGRTINDANGGGGSRGAPARGGEAQLVRFREREERIVLGRSWGRGVGGGRDAARRVRVAEAAPALGEDSMPVTLADGTRTYVRRGGARRGTPAVPTAGGEETTRTTRRRRGACWGCR